MAIVETLDIIFLLAEETHVSCPLPCTIARRLGIIIVRLSPRKRALVNSVRKRVI
jgi:hypothetical protein